MKANLHSHSYYSDGVETPETVAQLAAESHMELVALTDHNTFAGTPRFAAACQERKLPFVKGVEIDVVEPAMEYQSELLAYFPDGGSELLEPVLERKRQAYEQTVHLALKRSAGTFHLGKELSYDELQQMAFAEKGFVGMLSHKLLYRYLLRKGLQLPDYFVWQATEVWNAIWSKQDLPAQDTLLELIPQVVAMGGYPVLPHFGFHCRLDAVRMREQRELYLSRLRRMKEHGLWGIELHPYRSPEQAAAINAVIQEWAKELDLHLTFGSDYHGGISSHTQYDSLSGDFSGFC